MTTAATPFRDIAGFRSGSLTAVLRLDKERWMCLCDCGSFRAYWYSNILAGRQGSCGKDCPYCPFHGHAIKATREYRTWGSMKSRCYNKNNRGYERYGGRGIKMCDRWLDFKNFLADMGPKLPGMSIDRIDNDGDYEPSNCRWADRKTQMRNTSRTKLNAKVVARLRAGEITTKQAADMTGAHYTVAWKAKRGEKWA